MLQCHEKQSFGQPMEIVVLLREQISNAGVLLEKDRVVHFGRKTVLHVVLLCLKTKIT